MTWSPTKIIGGVRHEFGGTPSAKNVRNPTPNSGKIQHNSSLQHLYVSFVDSFNGGGLVIDFQLMIIVVSRKTAVNITQRVIRCW
jgi:hypothetical protein